MVGSNVEKDPMHNSKIGSGFTSDTVISWEFHMEIILTAINNAVFLIWETISNITISNIYCCNVIIELNGLDDAITLHQPGLRLATNMISLNF